MRFPASTSRALHGAVALAVVGAALAGCTKDTLPVPSAVKGLPRLAISDVRYVSRGELIGPGGTQADVDTAVTQLQLWKDLGVYMTSNVIVMVDPEIIVQTTSHKLVPPDEMVTEQVFGTTGGTTTRQAFRNPIFFLEYAEVKYNFSGYTMPVRRYELNLPMRQTYMTLDKIRVSNADQVLRAMWDKPDTTPPIVGTADITIYGRDLDPLLIDNKTSSALVTRSFPVRYTYGSALLGEAAQNKTPLVVPQPAIFGTPTPAASAAAPAP